LCFLYTVLYIPPGDSPEKAVRASIISGYQKLNTTELAMSKKSKNSNKKQKIIVEKSVEKAAKTISPKTDKSTRKIFLLTLTLISLIANVYFLAPRILVVPGAMVDQSNALSAPFTLTNISVTPIYISEIKLLIGTIISINGVHKGFESNFPISYPRRDMGVVSQKWQNIKLTKDSSITFATEDFANFPPVTANMSNIAIQVSYRSWFFPILRTKIFPFKTRLQSNGLLDWYAYPWEEAEEWAKKNPLPPEKPK
jgi:hypothetical protein